MAPRKKYLRVVFPAVAVGLLVSFFLYMTFRTHHKTIKHPKDKTKVDLKLAEHKIFRNADRARRFGTDRRVLITQAANAQAAMLPATWDEISDENMPAPLPPKRQIELKDAPALHAVGDEVVPDTEPHRSWFHSSTSIPRKVVVMGALASQDISWVVNELQGWSSAVYIVDSPTASLHTPANKGREALPYLTYIIEHYTKLPATIAFIHAHKEGYPTSWHTDNDRYSNVWSLTHLNVEHVQRAGFASLRCTPEPGCPDGMVLDRDPPNHNRTAELALPAAIQDMFGPDDEDAEIAIPPVLATPCCAQFAVSRTQVLKVPLRTYERMQRWVLETELSDATSGRVMEYLWHVVFGRDAVFCPEFERSWCDVYGDCLGLEEKEKQQKKEDEMKRQKLITQTREKHAHKRGG